MLVELNVSWRGENESIMMKADAKTLGFDTVALTTTVEDAVTLKTLAKSQDLRNPLESTKTYLPPNTITDESVGVIRRLHVELSTVQDLQHLHGYLKMNRKSWDLCSVKITEEQIWQRLLSSPQAQTVDIIQLEWYESSPPYRPNRHQLQLLASLEIYLEICLDKLLLTPAGVSANFFRNVALVCRHMPKSHILITTGASSSLYLRSPRDLHALGATLFGSEPAKQIVYENPRKVIERAEARKAIGICGFAVT